MSVGVLTEVIGTRSAHFRAIFFTILHLHYLTLHMYMSIACLVKS
jgi:hypothetical protein